MEPKTREEHMSDHGHGHEEDESVCFKVGIIFISVVITLFAIGLLQ